VTLGALAVLAVDGTDPVRSAAPVGSAAPITPASPSATSRTAVSPAPASQATRCYGFGQGWLFGGKYTEGAELPGHPDASFGRVTVPHTVIPLSATDWDYQAWEDRWIYRKHFTGRGLASADERVLLTFDGVMTSATVVLNGSTLTSHEGGYLPWTTELTGQLLPGDNVLAVIVDGRWLDVPPDALPGGPGTIDYLQPAGIYRDVTLHVVPPVYLADVFARPADVLLPQRTVRVTATIDAAAVPASARQDTSAVTITGTGRGTRTGTVTAVLLDGAGTPLAGAVATVAFPVTGTYTASLTIGGIPQVAYWSPDQPALYTVRTTLHYPGGGHVTDTTIGFREAVFREGGFYLNGARLEIFGLNRHQLYPHLGMAAPARLQRRDVEILKDELNVNMVRCSHYPQSPHFLDACDELGILVWEEPPGWGFMGDEAFRQRFLDDVTAMVRRDRNRPSVVVWGTRLDETANYPALYTRARDLAYANDGSRQTAGAVTFRTTGGWAEDLFGYDDYRVINGKPELYPPVSGVPYLVSEAVGAGVDPHYLWTDPPGTLANQAIAHALVHSQARADQRYAGLLAWAGFDYYSVPNDSAPGTAAKNWRSIRTPGVMDVFRVPKPGAAIYRSQVAAVARPVIIPVFCWDDRFPPGTEAMFATNCERLVLWLGNEPWLTVTPGKDTFGHLAHVPAFADLAGAVHARPARGPGGALGSRMRPATQGLPDLVIHGYTGTSRVATLRMTARTSGDRLELSVAGAAISGDGSDATAFTLRATDAYGNWRPGIDGDVTLTLAGPAELIAENPFPLAAFGGVGGGFIRSVPGTTGQVTLTAAHPTLGQARAVVQVS
jgi:beta-galactosidase